MDKSNETANGKVLRFASLIRVSTEKQEQKGESLRTQQRDNERNVELLGGRIIERYGGQEHATEGWERKELLRLTADAVKGNFDAVIIAYADRWDRGSEDAKEALKVFKQYGIRFFIGTTEYDLSNPDHVLLLDISAVIGKFQAANQNKKSILNRIARAKRGVPTGGRMPYGRIYDRKTGYGASTSISKSYSRRLPALSCRRWTADFGQGVRLAPRQSGRRSATIQATPGHCTFAPSVSTLTRRCRLRCRVFWT